MTNPQIVHIVSHYTNHGQWKSVLVCILYQGGNHDRAPTVGVSSRGCLHVFGYMQSFFAIIRNFYGLRPNRFCLRSGVSVETDFAVI